MYTLPTLIIFLLLAIDIHNTLKRSHEYVINYNITTSFQENNM